MSRRQTGFTRDTRQLIAERASDYNGWPTCEVMALCQGVPAEAVHHRRARGMGSSRRPDTNQPANGLAVCDADHYWIESNREKARGFGWLLEQTQTPAEVPVLRRGRWVLLDNCGDFAETTPLEAA